MQQIRKIELLAPAGNMEKLKTAFHFGADAVFVGGAAFNLRGMSSNFKNNELKEAKKYDSLENLINDVNSVVDRLTVEFGTQTDTYFKTLIKNDLFYAYQKTLRLV